jgi:hypothetical protein
MIKFNRNALNAIVPDMWEFTEASPPLLSGRIRDSGMLVYRFAIEEAFGVKYSPELRQIAVQCCRRALSAADSYVWMTECLKQYFLSHNREVPNFSKYFEALDAAESCVLQLQMSFEAARWAISANDKDRPVLGPRSNSVRNIANSIKHFGEHVRKNSSSTLDLPVWFSVNGIKSADDEVSFEALHQIVKDMLWTVEEIRSPTKFYKNMPA